MNTFIRNLFAFALFFLIVACSIVGASSAYMNRIKFTIDKSKHILVIGDSHTECAIDDSSFKRAANLSKSATSVVYSYASLRKLIADNPQIDTVLLSFHSSSLSKERDASWIFDETAMSTQVPEFLPYFTVNQFLLFLLKPQFYKQALQSPWTAWEYYKSNKHGERQNWIDRHIGNFRDLNWSNFSKDTAASKPWALTSKTDTASVIGVTYFRKFSTFCKQRNITLILINTPTYKWKTYADYQDYYKFRKQYLNDLLYLDYAEFPIADSCRFDIWHLNGTGARQFSSYLDTNLVKDLKRKYLENR